MHPARAKQQPRRSLVKAKPQPSHSRASIMPQACQRVPLALKPVAEAVELLRRVYAAAAEPSYTCANHACAAVSPPALRLMAANRRAAEAAAKPQPSHSQATAKPQPSHSHATAMPAMPERPRAKGVPGACIYLVPEGSGRFPVGSVWAAPVGHEGGPGRSRVSLDCTQSSRHFCFSPRADYPLSLRVSLGEGP